VLIEAGCKELKGRKVGMVTNPTGITWDLQHGVDVLYLHPGVSLLCVFGPEHGFRGTQQAGQSEGSSRDPRTGLPVYDLYRKRGADLERVLRKSGVDTLVFDIQDVGARFYTYLWLLHALLQAAHSLGLKVVVLDRPNPVGGEMVEGPCLQPPWHSDLGRHPLPVRHAMTLGELAGLFLDHLSATPGAAGFSLCVIPMAGWRRNMMFPDTGLQWVLPSPNMPSPATALLYLGTGLFEGTLASEGRGTTLPFHLVGAPWADHNLAREANLMVRKGAVRGCIFREAAFCPTFDKFSGQTISGVQVHVTDPKVFEAMRASLVLLVCMRKLYGSKLQWRPPTRGTYFVDLLAGSDVLRKALDSGASVDEIVALWQDDLKWFHIIREKFLLY